MYFIIYQIDQHSSTLFLLLFQKKRSVNLFLYIAKWRRQFACFFHLMTTIIPTVRLICPTTMRRHSLTRRSRISNLDKLAFFHPPHTILTMHSVWIQVVWRLNCYYMTRCFLLHQQVLKVMTISIPPCQMNCWLKRVFQQMLTMWAWHYQR